MNTVIYNFQERSKGKVTKPMTLWAICMAIVIFCYEAQYGNQHHVVDTGFVLTVLLGLYLGWQRRSGSVFIAPLVSWIFAWVPLWIAAMIHDGFIVGLFKGLFLVTFGWIAIGGAEFFVLLVTSTVVRIFRSKRINSDPEVYIFGPDDTQKKY